MVSRPLLHWVAMLRVRRGLEAAGIPAPDTPGRRDIPAQAGIIAAMTSMTSAGLVGRDGMQCSMWGGGGGMTTVTRGGWAGGCNRAWVA